MRFVVSVVISCALNLIVSADDRTTAPSQDATVVTSTGTIEGTVTYQADKSRPWRYARYYVKNRRAGQLAEAVVALTDRSLRNHERAEKPQTIVIDQKDFRFDPETVAIRAGDLVKFTNSDNAVHNVRTINPLHSFNVNMQSGGKHEEKFDRASGIRRPYRLGCDYHSSMRAWVFVFAHPYFQVTKADGKFRLDDVPPGDYDLEMAHPAGELKWTQKIKVTSGETTKIDIQVSPDDKTDAKQ
ncbi:MAG: hypothetical protein KDB27_04150 [Planctomycetales bacterium]|nr:hypothetical protein [Planctomycetales bacterium]